MGLGGNGRHAGPLPSGMSPSASHHSLALQMTSSEQYLAAGAFSGKRKANSHCRCILVSPRSFSYVHIILC